MTQEKIQDKEFDARKLNHCAVMPDAPKSGIERNSAIGKLHLSLFRSQRKRDLARSTGRGKHAVGTGVLILSTLAAAQPRDYDNQLKAT
jgi:hypothetical protein